jgi:glycosyltransferase involved in cell wall biosynthesis
VKVLFIGHYREQHSGWCQATKDCILALDAAGVDVVPRCVKLGLPTVELSQRILELESKSSHDCDICIQFVLPHLMDYNGGFKKNIGMYCTETDSFEYSNWVDKLNQMDELWVPTNQMIDAAHSSGVTTKLKFIPYPCDTAKFDRKKETLDIEPINGDFVFYFIGDLTTRKNLVALVKAFHLEFGTSEPVSLVLKASKHGFSEEENTKKISEACNFIKAGLKLYPRVEDYKPEIIISQHLSTSDLYKLHMTCDCFVMPSYGEAWSEPSMDALGFGNPVIALDVGGPSEYVTWDNGYLCGYHHEPVCGMNDTFPDLFTGYEDWYNVDISDLREAMREAYEAGKYSPKKTKAMSTPEKYSYKNVGQLMKGALCTI